MSNYRNLDRFLKPDVKLSSNGFPLESRDVFSTKVGLLNVAKIIPVVPNDYFEIDPTVFIQTDRFNVANFTRMSQHLDFFYVPMTSLQSRWNEWYQQTVDPANAIFDMHPITSEQSSDFVPYVHLGSLIWALLRANAWYYNDTVLDTRNKLVDKYGGDVSTLRLGTILLDTYDQVSPPIDGFVNYHGLFQGVDGNLSVLAKDKLGYPLFLNTIRLLDMLGYGNYLPIINLPIFTGSYDAIVANVDNYEAGDDLLGWIDNTMNTVIHFLNTLDKHINLYYLAAYQAVCHNYFTNPHFERPSVVAYNFDDLDSGDFFLHRFSIYPDKWNHLDYLRSLFEMNYTPWKKDIFLSALPSLQFGDVSVVSVLSDLVRLPSGLGNGAIGTGTTSVGSDLPLKLRIGSYPDVSLVGSFSVIDQVKANALQYWRQQIGRAGYRVADRFRATFGYSPVHSGHIMPRPIGSFNAQISKDPVYGSSGDDFAEKRATGSSLLQHGKIKFAADNEFGFIVAIHRILPEADYDAYGIDKHITKFDPFEFFTPAFQNIGLEALDVSELSVYNEAFYQGSSILGYVPRYHEYKTAVDKVHGEFCSMPFSLLANKDRGPSYSSGITVPSVGAFSSYVSSRIDLESYFGSVRQFYVDPAVVDNLFLVSANGEQKTDQFWITSYLDVKSYRSMSVLGLPQF